MFHIAIVAGCSIFIQNAERHIAAQCGWHVKDVREHTVKPGFVCRHIAVNKLLHNGSVNSKALSHKTEAGNYAFIAVCKRNGRNPGNRKRGCQVMETTESLFISDEVVNGSFFAVYFADGRRVFAGTHVVACACKKGSCRVNCLS